MSEDPLERLQSQVAHQDLAIEMLNETVVRQERLIEQLRAELGQVRRLLAALRPSPLDPDAAPEPPPPHY